jgi:hypothetical protein
MRMGKGLFWGYGRIAFPVVFKVDEIIRECKYRPKEYIAWKNYYKIG